MTIQHIEKSIADAVAGKSNMTAEIFQIRGFSTMTIRRLFHNLCDIDGTYLEVGLFCGASFCASFNKNCTSVGVEDHSQDFSAGFDNVKQELKENIIAFQHLAKDVKVHYADCFAMDISVLPKIDIYSYDGWHSEEHQAKALPYFFERMNDKFIWVIDDTNWDYVASGTKMALESLKDKIHIEKEWELRGSYLNNDPIWHNGVKIYLINKINQ
jgi:hypothetical protein